MSPAEKVLLIGMAGVLAAGSAVRWRPPDIGPALAYSHRCQLSPAAAPKAAAVALWTAHPEAQPCSK
jgi:hypothetical protein